MKVIALVEIPDGSNCTDCHFLELREPYCRCLVFQVGCRTKDRADGRTVYKCKKCVDAEDLTASAKLVFEGLDKLEGICDAFL